MRTQHIISLTTLLYLAWIGTAHALIINLNAALSKESNAVTSLFQAGEYTVTPIGTTDDGLYDAWKAWSSKPTLGNDGKYTTGWITKYAFESDAFGVKSYYSNVKYETAALALANAQVSSFTLSSAADVTFYISDSYYKDNSGGISLKVTQLNVVPEPATMLLFGLGLAGMASFLRRK